MNKSEESLSSDNSLTKKLIDERIIVLSESIQAKTAQKIIETLLAFDAIDNKKAILMFLNTTGGEINSGFAIFDVMRFIRANIKVIVTGFAASIGTVILLAAKKENRFILPNGKLLVHQPLIPGNIEGQASDIEIHAKEILAVREKIAQLYYKETKQPLEQIRKNMERDYWLTAEEALNYGFVSRILSNWQSFEFRE